MSACQTVNLTGNGGATFTNNDLSLSAQDWKETRDLYTHYDGFGPATYQDHVRENDTTVLLSTYSIGSIGAGIFATPLNAGGFALTNAGSPLAPVVNTAATQNAPATLGLSARSAALSFGGISATLPSNPAGYFVVSRPPEAQYLVGPDPRYRVIGADYLAQRYGYNPDIIQKRLAEANDEDWLYRQRFISRTDDNVLKGYSSESLLIQALMDLAAEEGCGLGLVFGTAPTPGQVANLTKDIVWMVTQEVAGQPVLVPTVYFASATRARIQENAPGNERGPRETGHPVK